MYSLELQGLGDGVYSLWLGAWGVARKERGFEVYTRQESRFDVRSLLPSPT